MENLGISVFIFPVLGRIGKTGKSFSWIGICTAVIITTFIMAAADWLQLRVNRLAITGEQ